MRDHSVMISVILVIGGAVAHIALPALCFPAGQMPDPVTGGSQTLVAADERFEPLRTRMLEMVHGGELPSLSIAVAENGEIIWEEALGWADRERRIRATPHTVYPLASLSKSITATGMMVLVERGMIDLDGPVQDYIGPAKPTVHEGRPEDLRVRHVLNMTGGIPHGSKSFWDGGPDEPLSLAEFFERYCVSVFPPGKVDHYSNISMAAADLMIERVSGRDLADFMRAEVFLPLGMARTSAHIGPGLDDFLATKYDSENNPIPHSYFQPMGGGGYHSSTHDLIRYGMFHLKDHLQDQSRILSDETLDLMHTDVADLPGAMFALGWGSIRMEGTRRWLLTNGGIGGACVTLSLVDGADVAVACLTNITSSSRVTDEMAVQVTDVLVPGFAEWVQKLMAEYEAEHEPKGEFRPTRQLVGIWEGEIAAFEQSLPVTMTIQEDGDIHIRPKGQYTALVNNAVFFNNRLEGVYVGWIPTENEMQGDHAIDLRLRLNGKRMTGFVRPNFSWGQGWYSLPAYVWLEKQ